MNNNKKAIKAGMFLTLGNYFVKGINLVSIPIFANLLTTSEFGVYNTVLAIEGIISVLMGVSIQTSYKNAKIKFDKKFENYVANTIILVIIVSILFGIVCMCFQNFIAKLLHIDSFVVIALVFFGFSNAIVLCFNEISAINYKYGDYLKCSLFIAVANIGISLVLMYSIFSNNRLLGRIIGTILPITIVGIYICYKLLKNRNIKIAKEQLKWGVGYSIPLIPHTLSIILLSQFDRIMILNMVGESEAGLYSFAYTMDTLINVTIQSIGAIWGPWFYEKMKENDYNCIKTVSHTYMLCMSAFISIILFCTSEIIYILGGAKYSASVYLALPIIVGTFFAFLYTIPGTVEYYYEKTKAISIGTGGAVIINIVLNFCFIKQFGCIAASYTTLITYFLYFVFHMIISKKIHSGNLFMKKSFVISIAIVCLSAILSMILKDFIFLRIILSAVILVTTLFYVNKKYAILSKLKNRKEGLR